MTFTCIEDHKCPAEIHEAGLAGNLSCDSVIGFIALSAEDYTYVRNGCTYKIVNEDS